MFANFDCCADTVKLARVINKPTIFFMLDYVSILMDTIFFSKIEREACTAVKIFKPGIHFITLTLLWIVALIISFRFYPKSLSAFGGMQPGNGHSVPTNVSLHTNGCW